MGMSSGGIVIALTQPSQRRDSKPKYNSIYGTVCQTTEFQTGTPIPKHAEKRH
jgi:hypothetical protein